MTIFSKECFVFFCFWGIFFSLFLFCEAKFRLRMSLVRKLSWLFGAETLLDSGYHLTILFNALSTQRYSISFLGLQICVSSLLCFSNESFFFIVMSRLEWFNGCLKWIIKLAQDFLTKTSQIHLKLEEIPKKFNTISAFFLFLASAKRLFWQEWL